MPDARMAICLLGVSLMMVGHNGAAHGESPKSADPWSTMRGCLVVLERLAGCSNDKSFQPYRQRWTAAAGGPATASREEVARRLKSWGRPAGRRQQCAVWARKHGADEHIAEGTALAKLAEDRGRSTCETFGKRVEEDGWLPKALVDRKED